MELTNYLIGMEFQEQKLYSFSSLLGVWLFAIIGLIGIVVFTLYLFNVEKISTSSFLILGFSILSILFSLVLSNLTPKIITVKIGNQTIPITQQQKDILIKNKQKHIYTDLTEEEALTILTRLLQEDLNITNRFIEKERTLSN